MIGKTEIGGATKLTPTGNIGMEGTEALQKSLEDALAAGGGIEVDLSSCRSLSSSAIGAMIACHNALRTRDGGRLKVSGTSDDLRKLLRLMGLDRHFELA